MLLEISYDAFGRRIETVEYVDPATGDQLSGEKVTRHVMLGAETIEEYDLTDGGETCTLARQFVWGREFPEPVGLIDYTGAGTVSAGTAEYFHYLRDRLHSVVALTDNSGTLVEHYRYDAYGRTHVYDDSNTLLASSALGNPLAWTGQRYDPAVRLYHFLFRGYSPALGRWLQRDLLEYVDSVSLYEYVNGQPNSWIDPLGLEKCPETLRKEWEKETGKEWPKTEDGRNYDAHHRKPKADGGEDHGRNIEPLKHDDHVEHHKKQGDFKRWGARAKDALKAIGRGAGRVIRVIRVIGSPVYVFPGQDCALNPTPENCGT